MRRLILFAAKAAISASLLYLAFRSVNIENIRARLNDVHIGWIVAAILLLIAQVIPFSLRWRQIALQCGASLPVEKALRFGFIATFFNQVLPSTIGGDGVRIWLLGRSGAKWKAATYSVLIDRATGLMALSLLLLVCLPWTLALVRHPVGRNTLIALEAVTLAGGIVFLALGRIDGSWLKGWWPTRHLTDVAATAYRVLTGPRLPLIAALSLGIHLLTVAATWCAARAIAAPLDFGQALMLVLPVILVASIPISIAGWGVRESAMMAAFGYAGLAETDGLVVSILFGIAVVIAAASGGVVWILSNEQRAAWAAGDHASSQ